MPRMEEKLAACRVVAVVGVLASSYLASIVVGERKLRTIASLCVPPAPF